MRLMYKLLKLRKSFLISDCTQFRSRLAGNCKFLGWEIPPRQKKMHAINTGLCVCWWGAWVVQKRLNGSRRLGCEFTGHGNLVTAGRWFRLVIDTFGAYSWACALQSYSQSIFSTLFTRTSSDAAFGYRYCSNLLSEKLIKSFLKPHKLPLRTAQIRLELHARIQP